MGTRTEHEKAPLCSWCHKSQDEVAVLIATPTDLPPPRAYICDECVAVCGSILDDHKNGKIRPVSPAAHLLKPLEQKDTLAELLIGKYKSKEEFRESIRDCVNQRLKDHMRNTNTANSANAANSTNSATEVQEGAIQ